MYIKQQDLLLFVWMGGMVSCFVGKT